MAKRSSRRATTASRAIVVRPMPAAASKPIIIRQVRPMRAPKHHHRRGARPGGGGERHRLGALIGAAVLGMLDKSSTNLPALPFLGKAGTAGVAAWAAGKFLKNRWADDAATGMLSIAVYELMKDGTIAGDPNVDGAYVAGAL